MTTTTRIDTQIDHFDDGDFRGATIAFGEADQCGHRYEVSIDTPSDFRGFTVQTNWNNFFERRSTPAEAFAAAFELINQRIQEGF